MNAFLQQIKDSKLVSSDRTKRMIKISSIALVVVVFLFGILAGSLLTYSYGKIERARVSVLNSVDSWRSFDLDEASKSLYITESQLLSLKKVTDRLNFLVRVPVVGKRVLAADTMVESSLNALSSYEEVIEVTGELVPYRDIAYNNIEQKDHLIATMGEMINALEDVYINIQQMIATTHELGISDLAIVERFENEFSRYQEDDFKVLRLMHNVLSKREEQTFLLLMQNNTELRPTGGYIGNFGILKIRDGEVPQFYLKDTDTLPQVARENPGALEREPIVPPQPLLKHFSESRWRFGDANWAVSFPQTARNAQDLYNVEVAQTADEQEVFDGVIAFNPELVKDWLAALGDVKIETTENVTYTAANFSDTPQYVFPGERVNGKVITEKTYIVDAIAQDVRDKFTDATFGLLFNMVSTLRHNLNDRNLFFYAADSSLQENIVANGWSGELAPAGEDYLMVVDANLSRLRLDHLVARRLEYDVDDVDGTYVAELTASYLYNTSAELTDGLFDEVFGEYTTYTRIYVPQGASLISYEGSDAVDVYNELGKTVFGAFIKIRPNSTHDLKLTYALPFIQNDEDYELILQKQSGNEFTAFKITLPLFEDAEVFSPQNPQVNDSAGTAVWQGTLDESQTFTIRKE